MKPIKLLMKSSQCRNIPGYEDSMLYSVLCTDLPDYLKDQWYQANEMNGDVCTDKKKLQPCVIVTAILLPNMQVDNISVHYYFNEDKSFSLSRKDRQQLEESIQEYCIENGWFYPDAYNPITKELLSKEDWEAAANVISESLKDRQVSSYQKDIEDFDIDT